MEPAHQKVFYMVLGGKEVGKNQLMLAGHPTESALQAEIDGILYFREYKFYLREEKNYSRQHLKFSRFQFSRAIQG